MSTSSTSTKKTSSSQEEGIRPPSPSASATSSRISLKDDLPQREWICQLLHKYLAKYIRDYISSRRDTSGSPVTSEISLPDENGNSKVEEEGGGNGESRSLTASVGRVFDEKLDQQEGEQDEVEANLKSMITLTELEMTEETALGDDRITYLSRIISVAVSYSVGKVTGHPDHFMQWLVKVPSKYMDERNLARLTNAYQREVSFYSKILQDIKLWLELNPVMASGDEGRSEIIVLNVPICYYAKATDTQTDYDSKAYEFPNAEFTLILDDLRAHGFGKRHYSNGLTVTETMEALREIAKLHAISWAMTEHSHEKVLSWPDMLTWKELYMIHLEMIQQGFKHVRQIQSHFEQDKPRMKLLDELLKLESKLPVILEALLRPLSAPAVTALVHMDFWTDNLLFKENQYEVEPEEKEGEEEGASEPTTEIDIDCMIVDWQMVSLGRISHDLGILLVTSLDGDLRREYGMGFLKFYYETFERITGLYKLEVPFEMADLVSQYTESCLLAVLLAVGRFDLVTSEQSTMDRFFHALEDLKEEGLI